MLSKALGLTKVPCPRKINRYKYSVSCQLKMRYDYSIVGARHGVKIVVWRDENSTCGTSERWD